MTNKNLKTVLLACTAAFFSMALVAGCSDEKKTTETEINSTEIKADNEVMDTTGKTKPVKGGSVSDESPTPAQ